MRVLSYNKLQNYLTISATNENANYPIENIFHYYLTKIFKTTADTTIIDIDFATDEIMDCFFFAYTNLGVGSTIVVQFFNAGAGLLLTLNLATTSYYVLKSFFTQLTTVRSVVITITNAIPATAFYVGTTWAGLSTLLPDVESHNKAGFSGALKGTKSTNGQISGQSHALLDTVGFTFHIIETQAMLDAIKDYYETVNTSVPHFIAPYENIDRFTLYCNIVNTNMEYINQNEIDYRYKNLEIAYEEAK